MNKFLDEIEVCIPQMRRYALALLRNPTAGDDLVQDSLEKAISKQNTWSGKGSLKSWIFKIMLNTYRDDLRRAKARPQLVEIEDFDDIAPLQSKSTHQENRLLLNETANAIECLPVDQKQALLLVSLEGYNYAEAAQLLDIPIGTLMSRLGRARQFLRDKREGKIQTTHRLRVIKK